MVGAGPRLRGAAHAARLELAISPAGIAGEHDVCDALIHQDRTIGAHVVFNEFATCRITGQEQHVVCSPHKF